MKLVRRNIMNHSLRIPAFPRVLRGIVFLALCSIFALASLPSQAQQMRYVRYSNGTGFFVTKEGNIVTNAHVIRGCRGPVMVTNRSIQTRAQVIARNDALDLAVLRAERYAPAIAYLRVNDMTITRGDDVVVMGYAGQNGANGTYSFVKSKVLDPRGPFNNPQQLQFANAAQKGNSGGPLLDKSGHVIGVITGKAQLFRKDLRANVAPTKVAEADVAASLPALKSYLDQQRIRYHSSNSGMLSFSDNRLETAAQHFIVQLKCQTSQ